MLAFYGICILGLVGAAFWGLSRYTATVAANAASTADAVSTQQANATATASAYLAEQDQYEYIERFETDTSHWFTGETTPAEYGNVNAAIRNGVYLWDIVDSKGYIQGTDFYRGSTVRDFDMYVDLKFADTAAPDTTCGGLVFRKSSLGWDGGAYIFSICGDSSYEIYYFKSGEWDSIAYGYENAIRLADWNRVAVEARKDHYTFTINSITIYKMTDDRRKSGSLGLFIDVKEGESAALWFDNFGFQTR
jgi:hypothetical protein